ncbi:type 4a pilus biogenesis protein PilO [Actinoplanes sp. NPDC049118]|uniref:type 4a pilus biogenesis protein PilO n=1 Tax=Actinoplanes sp. NPDC049118 TaxID=3155769 RepID=UPI0034027D77
MRTRHADRLWVIAGAVVVALLGAVTWLLLVNPQHTEAADLEEQTEAATAQVTQLRKRNAELAADQAKIGELTKQYDALAAALPPDSGVPEFLRQLQASGNAVDVEVSGITVGVPAEEKTSPGVWALPIQLNAEGTAKRLGAFLQLLQGADQKRAVLIETANVSAGDSDDNESDAAPQMLLNLGIKAFVAPPPGAGAPKVTAD